MQHPSNRASRDTDEQFRGNGQAEQQPATGAAIRLSTIMPPTVLVTELDNGTLILQGRPDGPRVWLSPADAVPLRRELVSAFRSTKLAVADDDQGQIR